MAKRKKVIKGIWLDEEVRLLTKLFPNKSTKEVADRLNRSTFSVSHKACMLGLRKRARTIGRRI